MALLAVACRAFERHLPDRHMPDLFWLGKCIPGISFCDHPLPLRQRQRKLRSPGGNRGGQSPWRVLPDVEAAEKTVVLRILIPRGYSHTG